MSNHTINKPETYQYQAEMKRLLHLIIHSLYSHPEVFLRELVSNSSDALNKIRVKLLVNEPIRQPELELAIRINVNKETGEFSLEDTGIGMSKGDLINKIGTIAGSGTVEFLEQIKNTQNNINTELIGKFGVGFYSVFMVTDEATVETLHYDEKESAQIWKSNAESSFTIEDGERQNRGTRISFKFKEEYKHFCDDYFINNILKKYSNFVDFPIYLNNEKVNSVSAIWHKKKEDISEEELKDFYTFISNDYQEPLGHLQLNIEGNINFKALLFIPKTAPAMLFKDIGDKTLHLYSNRVFIQDNAQELIPEYLRFVKGVIDTEDLPLNVSRETTQSSPVMNKIKNVITGKILGLLEEWEQKQPEKYNEFFKQFGPLFKTGVNSDFTNKDKIVRLLKFESSELESGELTSFNGYISRADSEQKEIYYIAGNSREMVEKNPNLEYFKSKKIEVLLLTDPVDLFTVPYIFEFEGKKIVSIEKAEIPDIKTTEPENQETNDMVSGLIQTMKNILGDEIEDVKVSKRLVNSAFTLVSGEQSMDNQMEKMMQMIDKNFTASKKVLEINPDNALIKNLAKINTADANDPLLRDSIKQLYDSALLIDGNLKNPLDYVVRMTELLTKATEIK